MYTARALSNMQGFDSALAAAHEYALGVDRAAYMWAFRAIESVTDGRDAIFTGKLANAALCGDGAISEYTYDIALRNKSAAPPYLDAVCTAAGDKGMLIVLRTTIDDREYELDVDGRKIARMFVVGRRGDTDIIDKIPRADAVSPITGGQISVCGPDVALLGVLRTLYTPSLAGNWEAEWRVYNALIGAKNGGSSALHVAEYAKTAIEVAGIFGAGGRRGRDHDRGRDHANIHKSDIIPAGAVLIGDWALQRLGIIDSTDRHLQCLTDMPISEVAKRVERKTGKTIRVVKYWTGIPGDFQLSKHTLYAVYGDNQRPLLDVYNSPAYEMIPLAAAAKPTAGLIALLRFLLIDLWILRMIGSDRLVGSVADSISACARAIADANPADLWPIERDKWVGVFTLEAPAKMRIFGMSKTAPELCPA